MGDGWNTFKDIMVSVVGSLCGGRVASALHLGPVGQIAGGIAGGMAANDVEHDAERKG